MTKICIDAGHGGTDSGAVNGKIYEKNITLNLALKVGALLNDKFDIVYTRKKDETVSLANRCAICDKLDSDYFISIHVNSASNKQASGIETFIYTKPTQKAITISNNIQKNLIQATGAKNRGVKKANYYVIKNTLVPAVLIEVGFLSNEEELKKLISDDYQFKLAKAIADGILKSLN